MNMSKFSIGDVVKINRPPMESHDMKGVIVDKLPANMYLVLLEDRRQCPYYDYELAHVEI